MTNLFPFLFLSFPDFYHLSLTFSGLFTSFLDWSGRDKLVPFRISTNFSDFSRIGPAVTKLISFMFVSFPDLSAFFEFFRIGLAMTHLFPFLFLSFPDFPDFFRRFPDAFARHNFCSLSCSCHFRISPDFSDFSGLVRLYPNLEDPLIHKFVPNPCFDTLFAPSSAFSEASAFGTLG